MQHKSCIYTLSTLGTGPYPPAASRSPLCKHTDCFRAGGRECTLVLYSQHSYLSVCPVLGVGPFSFSTKTFYSFDTLLHHIFHPVWSVYDHGCSHLQLKEMLGPIHPATPLLWPLEFVRSLPPWHLISEYIFSWHSHSLSKRMGKMAVHNKTIHILLFTFSSVIHLPGSNACRWNRLYMTFSFCSSQTKEQWRRQPARTLRTQHSASPHCCFQGEL